MYHVNGMYFETLDIAIDDAVGLYALLQRDNLANGAIEIENEQCEVVARVDGHGVSIISADGSIDFEHSEEGASNE